MSSPPAPMRGLLRWFLLACMLAALPAGPGRAEALIGANKFDLLQQYAGFASRGDGSRPYARVTRAMARKSVLDARDAGMGFLRVSMSGFFPIEHRDRRRDLLTIWHADPAAYWALVDAMLDDLDRAGLRLVPTLIWNLRQFPALAEETVPALMRDPDSRSRALAVRFVTGFVERYRTRRTVLFYELGNEYNLTADIDAERRCKERRPPTPAACAVVGNFGTDDLNGFARDMVAAIRRVDAVRAISSGYSLPRPSAMNLARRPEWSPGGPDWTPDRPEEQRRYIAETHAPFDIVSVHAYAPNRPGQDPGRAVERVLEVGRIAHSLGKKMFVGEFGDTGATPFMHALTEALRGESVDYAAVWAWQFYQTAPFRSFDTEATRFNVEPGLRDDVIGLLSPFGRHPRPEAAAPRVVLSWPLPCSRLDKPVTLSATASEGTRAPERVEFLLDGQPVGEAGAPPYRVEFDPRAKGARQARIEAKAYGRSGATAVDGAPVLLNGGQDSCSVPSDD